MKARRVEQTLRFCQVVGVEASLIPSEFTMGAGFAEEWTGQLSRVLNGATVLHHFAI